MKKVVIVADLQALLCYPCTNSNWLVVMDTHQEYANLHADESPLDETDEAMKKKGYDSYDFSDLSVLDKAG
jgi:uncharacterized protein YcfL